MHLSPVEANVVLSTPVVAVLMAVHSSANPLHFCESLGSMRQQTYRAMRIFLYCDGPLSPPLDAAIERHLVCAPGQDVVLRNEKPKGLATGLNCLIDRALQDTSIRYLARMDSDDLSTPNRIASQVAFMESRPEVTVAGTWVIEFTTPGQSDFHKQLPSAPTEVAQFMLYRSPLAHPTVMFRRGVFERGHRYDPRRLIMQDYELWSRLLLAGEVISNVPEYLLWFRMAPGFFARRSGFNRAWGEVKERFLFAKHTGLLRPIHLLGFSALFALRLMPSSLKRLAYRHLRRGPAKID